jgi:(p)ppGpp synthase/HD superfamily hydrolase
MAELIEINGEKLTLPSCTEAELVQKLQESRIWHEIIAAAIAQAHAAHTQQPLNNKATLNGNALPEPYLEGHIFPVTSEVADYMQAREDSVGINMIRTVVVSSILHDALDDNAFDLGKCQEEFGLEVSRIVYSLTKYGDDHDIYLSKLRNSNSSSDYPIVIKTLARINNLVRATVNAEADPDRLLKYTSETETEFLPIAEVILTDNELLERLRRTIDIGRTALSK